MGLASLSGQMTRASYDGVQWNEAELALFEVAALLASAAIGVLHVVDTVYEAWPLPTSRVRRGGRASHPDRVMRASAVRRHSR
jgi:hypothetical protein